MEKSESDCILSAPVAIFRRGMFGRWLFLGDGSLEGEEDIQYVEIEIRTHGNSGIEDSYPMGVAKVLDYHAM